SAGVNGTGAENQNNVTAFGYDGNNTPIYVVNGSVNVTVVKPHLILNKSSNTSIIGVGEYINFYLNITNIGNGTAIGVNVTDILPYGFRYNDTKYIKINGEELNVSLFEKCTANNESMDCCNSTINPNWENTYYYNASCDITIQTDSTKQNVTWMLNATLHPLEKILINFTAYVTSSASPGNNTNFAYVNGSFLSGEPLTEENKENITLNVTVCKPNLTISKKIESINNDRKKITLNVTNIGCAPAYYVEISDLLPIGWIYDYTSRVVKTNSTGNTFDIPYSIVLGNPIIWKPYDSIDPLNLNPDLNPNESIIVIFYVIITEDARQGNNTNYANVSYRDADNGTYSSNTSNMSSVQIPIEISKTANVTNVKNGDYVNFVIHVRNPILNKDPVTGKVINFPEGCIYNLTITDLLPDTWIFNDTKNITAALTYPNHTTLIFIPITPPDYNETYNQTTNEIIWILHKEHSDPTYNNSFCPGSELFINFTVRVGDNVPVNGIATNYVNVTGKDINGSDWILSENSTNINVIEDAFLNVTKEILNKKQSYNIGDTIEFKINVSNPKANVQYNVTVEDILPCGLNISDDTFKVEHNTSNYNCSITGEACGDNCGMKLICRFDNISQYNYTLIYLNATILNCTNPGQHDNYVKADGSTASGKLYEKHDHVEFSVADFGELQVIKTSNSSGILQPGDNVTYTVKLINSGGRNLTANVTDVLPYGMECNTTNYTNVFIPA
ncbi:MAG: hypothetical protein ACK4YO_02465, partial [Candidatus Altarchaeaceae archaeon]